MRALLACDICPAKCQCIYLKTMLFTFSNSFMINQIKMCLVRAFYTAINQLDNDRKHGFSFFFNSPFLGTQSPISFFTTQKKRSGNKILQHLALMVLG